VARCEEHWILEQREGSVDGPCCQAEQLLAAVCHVLALCTEGTEELQWEGARVGGWDAAQASTHTAGFFRGCSCSGVGSGNLHLVGA